MEIIFLKEESFKYDDSSDYVNKYKMFTQNKVDESNMQDYLRSTNMFLNYILGK